MSWNIRLRQRRQDLPNLPPPRQMRGQKVAFPPFCEMVQKTGERGTRPMVSIINESAVLTSCETSSGSPHLSVGEWERGKGGGGCIWAGIQSPLPSQMHNSVFLSQQPVLRKAQLPQPCGRQSANMKEAQNSLCCSFRISGCTHSQSYLYDLFSLFIHGVSLEPWWTSWKPLLSLSGSSHRTWQRKCVGISVGCQRHWSSLTSHWSLVLLLFLRGPPLSQWTATLPCPQ